MANSYDLVIEAQSAYGEGKYGEALSLYEQALDLTPNPSPDRPALYAAIGMCLLHQGDPDAATGWLEAAGWSSDEIEAQRAAVLGPAPRDTTGEARKDAFERGKQAFDSADYDLAIEIWSELLGSLPLTNRNRAELLWMLGLAHMYRGDREVGRDLMRQGGYGDQEILDAERQYLRQELAEVATEAATASREPAPAMPRFRTEQYAEYYRSARGYEATGEFALAAELYQSAWPGYAGDDPADLAMPIARCELLAGHAAAARQTLGDAGLEGRWDALETEATAPIYEEAASAVAAGDYGTALILFRRMLDMSLPGEDINRASLWNIGVCDVHLGDTEAGRQAMRDSGASDTEIEAAATAASVP